jgi:hypothetical protein
MSAMPPIATMERTYQHVSDVPIASLRTAINLTVSEHVSRQGPAARDAARPKSAPKCVGGAERFSSTAVMLSLAPVSSVRS